MENRMPPPTLLQNGEKCVTLQCKKKNNFLILIYKRMGFNLLKGKRGIIFGALKSKFMM